MELNKLAELQLELLESLDLEVTDPVDLIDLGKTLLESYKKSIATIYSGHKFDPAWSVIAKSSKISLDTLNNVLYQSLTPGYIQSLVPSAKIKYIKLLSSLQELPTYEDRIKHNRLKSEKTTVIDEIDFSIYEEFLEDGD